jgi:antitoxin HicB
MNCRLPSVAPGGRHPLKALQPAAPCIATTIPPSLALPLRMIRQRQRARGAIAARPRRWDFIDSMLPSPTMTGRIVVKGHDAVDQKRTFAVVLEPEAEGGFTVRVPSLPEIVTYGKDEREALAMAEDAIRLVLEDCVARGEPVPEGEAPRIREVTVTLAA